MALPWIPVAYERLSGGLNTQSGDTYLEDGQFPTLLNFHTDTDGALTLRNGYASVHVNLVDAAAPVGTGLFQLRVDGFANQTLKTCKTSPFATAYLRLRNGTTGWTNIAPTAFVPSNHAFAHLVQYKNFAYLFFWEGTNRVMKYDRAAATWVEVAGAPRAYYGALFQERMFAIRDPASPSTLYFTAVGDGDNYVGGGAGSMEIGSGDGDQLMGIAVLFHRLIVLKRHSVWVVDGNDYASFTAQKVTGDVGAVSPRMVLTIENKVFFLSDKGWAATDGSTVESISELIRPTRNALNRARDVYGFAVHHRRRSQYIATASDSGSSTHNVSLVNKYPSAIEVASVGGAAGWTKFTQWPFNAGCVMTNANTEDDVYFVHASNGKFYIYDRDEAGLDIGGDDGANIPFDLRTRWMEHLDENGQRATGRTKFWRRLTVTFKTTGTALSWVCSGRFGMQVGSQWLQLRVIANADLGVDIQCYTDQDGEGFDGSTVQHTIVMNPPAGLTLVGIQKYTIEAQVTGNKGARAN